MKGSFLLHTDSLCILEKLSREQRGDFIYALYHYQLHGTLPLHTDLLLELVLTPFINQFARDDEKYKQVVERNQINGKKGGRKPKIHREKVTQPTPTEQAPITNASQPTPEPLFKEPTTAADEGKIWASVVKAWFDFYGKNFTDEENKPAKPDFSDNAPARSSLEKIIKKIKKGTLAKGQKQWNEQTAYDNCTLFFKRAFEKSTWLKENFELKNMLTNYDSIINQNTNTNKNGTTKQPVKAGGIKVKRNNFGQSSDLEHTTNG